MNYGLNLFELFILAYESLPVCVYPSCDPGGICSFRIFAFHNHLSGIGSRTVQYSTLVSSVWVSD
jgi:hypothetical protein